MNKILVKAIVIIVIALFFAIIFTACTDNRMAREYGGTQTITLEPGYKLVEATWKGDNLWYLVEPMEEGYIPSKKEFIESSSYGLYEGKVVFIERDK